MTEIRPARSSGAPVCSDRVRPSDDACTPAAQILVAVTIRSVRPSLCCTVIAPSSTSVTIAPSTTSTPSPSSSVLGPGAELGAERRQHLRGGVEQDHRAPTGVLIARKSRRSVRWASSAICPAISTPVGPAPTTTKVRRRVDVLAAVGAELGHLEGTEDAPAQLERVVDRLHARARTRRTGRCRSRTAPRPPPRSASRTTSSSRGRARERSRCAAVRSMSVTVPSSTWVLAWPRQHLPRRAARSRPRRGCPVATW